MVTKLVTLVVSVTTVTVSVTVNSPAVLVFTDGARGTVLVDVETRLFTFTLVDTVMVSLATFVLVNDNVWVTVSGFIDVDDFTKVVVVWVEVVVVSVFFNVVINVAVDVVVLTTLVDVAVMITLVGSVVVVVP